jgi:F-type H+-transporting ATPase subunit epsilon
MAQGNNPTFNFELVSPDKILVSEQAWQVTMPGEKGYFGVRAGHTSLIAAVKAGTVEIIKTEGSAPEKIFVAGGFADVTATNCSLLAEQALRVSEIDAAAVKQEISNLDEDLARVQDLAERRQIENRREIAHAKLAAVEGI